MRANDQRASVASMLERGADWTVNALTMLSKDAPASAGRRILLLSRPRFVGGMPLVAVTCIIRARWEGCRASGSMVVRMWCTVGKGKRRPRNDRMDRASRHWDTGKLSKWLWSMSDRREIDMARWLSSVGGRSKRSLREGSKT